MAKGTGGFFEREALTNFESDYSKGILLYLNFLKQKRFSKFFVDLFGIGFSM
jgi:hypothetical protein